MISSLRSAEGDRDAVENLYIIWASMLILKEDVGRIAGGAVVGSYKEFSMDRAGREKPVRWVTCAATHADIDPE